MTIQEMHHLFRVKLDRIDSSYYENILSVEVDMFLNDAQNVFIRKRLPTSEVRATLEENQKVQNDLKEIMTSDTLLTVSTDQTGVKPGAIFFDLPSDYMYAVQEEAEIAFTDCNNNPATERRGYIGVTHAEYLMSKDDPFFVPTTYENFGLRLMSSNKIEALTFNNFDINYYYLRYIRRPGLMQYTDNTSVISGQLIIGKQYKVLTGTITHYGSGFSAGDTFIAQASTFSGTGTVALNGIDCELNPEAQREIIDIAIDLALDVIESPRAQSYKLKILQQE